MAVPKTTETKLYMYSSGSEQARQIIEGLHKYPIPISSVSKQDILLSSAMRLMGQHCAVLKKVKNDVGMGLLV